MIGYAVNDVLPRFGELARVVNMNRITRVPVAKLLTTLVAERILDVVVLVLLLGLSFWIEGDVIAEKIPWLAQAGYVAMLLAGAGLAGIVAVAFASEFLCRFTGNLVRRFHERTGEVVEKLIRQGAEGLAFCRRPGRALLILVETLGIWILYLGTFILGLAAFGILDGIGYEGGTVSFSVATVGILVPSVGGIGSYHAAGKEVLDTLYAVEPDLALAFMIVIHAICLYLVGGLGGILAWVAQLWIRGKERDR
jgi:hypothetical protein